MPNDTQPAPPAQPRPQKRKKGALRENVESFGVALAVALLVRWIVIEPFKIPTGSMAPTLSGAHRTIKCPNCGLKFKLDRQLDTAICPNCLAQIDAFENRKWKGDRILVWKFLYHLSKPRRWDVIVFVYPFCDAKCRNCGYVTTDAPPDIKACPNCGSTHLKIIRKNFIKRLVGLPGETIYIAGGDVFINGRIARKPHRVQKILWLPVYDMRYKPKKRYFTPWTPESGEWKLSEDKLQCHASADAPAIVRFHRIVKDRVAYQGGGASLHFPCDDVVRDLLVEASARCGQEVGNVELEIAFDRERFKALTPLRGGECLLLRSGRVVKSAPAPSLESGVSHRFRLAHADARVELWVDGNRLLRYEYETSPEERDRELQSNRIALGVDKGRAEFYDIRIRRDVYYLKEQGFRFHEYATEKPFQIGPKEYFVLGDNSPNSKDSRMWGVVPARNLLGRAFSVFWPVTDAKMLRGFDGLE